MGERRERNEAEAEEWGAISFEVMERSKGYRGFKEYFEAVKEYSENIAMAGKKRYSEETGKEGAVTILPPSKRNAPHPAPAEPPSPLGKGDREAVDEGCVVNFYCHFRFSHV